MPLSVVFQLFSGGKENNPKLFWDFCCCCCWSHVLLGICLGLWHESLGTSCDCLAYEWEHPHPAPSPLTKGGQTAVAWKPKLVTILLCCAAMNLPLLFLVAQHFAHCHLVFSWNVSHIFTNISFGKISKHWFSSVKTLPTGSLFSVSVFLCVCFVMWTFHSVRDGHSFFSFCCFKTEELMLFLSTFNRLLKHITNKNDSQR